MGKTLPGADAEPCLGWTSQSRALLGLPWRAVPAPEMSGVIS